MLASSGCGGRGPALWRHGACNNFLRRSARDRRDSSLLFVGMGRIGRTRRQRAVFRVFASASSSSFACVSETGHGVGAASVVLDSTIDRLRATGIIACLRTNSSDVALDAARAALDGGLGVIEVTMTTPSAPSVIHSLVREYPTAIIGAGTVLSLQDAEMAKEAGAKFLTSPVTVEDMVVAHKDGPVAFFPGAMTPTEVITAYNMGARAVKLFPVALLGHLKFVLAIMKTLDHIPIIPSNGIPTDMVESYLKAGVMAVILSDAVFERSALESKDFNKVRYLAVQAMSKSNQNITRMNQL